MNSTIAPPASPCELDLRSDLDDARDLGTIASGENLTIRAAQGVKSVWLTLALDGFVVVHLRLGPNAGKITNVQQWSRSDGTAGLEFTTPLGPMRAKLALHDRATLRCTTSLLPARETCVSSWPRDLYVPGAEHRTIHTHQRGLRSGIVFASADLPVPFSMFYFQDFSSLNDYFVETKRTPADTVGGTWPVIGYAPPAGDRCILPEARETVVSDAYISLSNDVPKAEESVAALYLDKLAHIYLLLGRPRAEYHDWPERAAHALRDLSLSPACTYVRQGHRFLMPYVADEAKPPESMVQFTAAVNAGEYDQWRREESRLTAALRNSAGSFFDEAVGTVVRWLPGEAFNNAQAEDNMSHEAMDSWYIHHALFNVFRLARNGDKDAKRMFKDSLPYLIRVAHRFDYRWPVFFHLQTLDVIRAEAKPGEGGETDVSGLYALVMIHAYEMFGDVRFLNEAEIAVSHLHGLGFDLAYQLNTTGFAAEAALRLWKITQKRRYLGLSESCLANLFDNMWLWQCAYGNARHYRTFFGLFPLRDAPYLAPYEELEAHAKFHQYLELGGDDVRPSLRLLIAEFQKYSLDRSWYYYPASLPIDSIADKPRNGRIERGLTVPLEDLQDGLEKSGQVGQELYGAGLPFVLTARHYMRLDRAGTIAFCNYPMFDFTITDEGVARWRAGGDPRGSCDLRVLPADANETPRAISVSVLAGEVRVPVRGTISAEGHATFSVRGGQTIEIACEDPADSGEEAITIGALSAQG